MENQTEINTFTQYEIGVILWFASKDEMFNPYSPISSRVYDNTIQKLLRLGIIKNAPLPNNDRDRYEATPNLYYHLRNICMLEYKSKPRESGFYWVQKIASNDKEVAHYFEGEWWITGEEKHFQVGKFTYISNEPIKSPTI